MAGCGATNHSNCCSGDGIETIAMTAHADWSGETVRGVDVTVNLALSNWSVKNVHEATPETKAPLPKREASASLYSHTMIIWVSRT